MFMKHPANKIVQSNQATPGVDGYVFDGVANVERESLRSIRNYAILAMLIGCGLRRGVLLALRVESIQLREER